MLCSGAVGENYWVFFNVRRRNTSAVTAITSRAPRPMNNLLVSSVSWVEVMMVSSGSFAGTEVDGVTRGFPF